MLRRVVDQKLINLFHTDETLQPVFETENRPENFPERVPETRSDTPKGDETHPEGVTEEKKKKKGGKVYPCAQCGRVFAHKNSLAYHILMHGDKQQACRECGKCFYTVHALKVTAQYY